MRLLFTLDREDYTPDMPVNERHCVRAIIRKDDLLAVQRSADGEYKLPGGGIEDGETARKTLEREVLEEVGYHVCADSIEEIGEVVEKRRDVFDGDYTYINHTYFFLCKVEGAQEATSLTPEEAARGYVPVFKPTSEIIAANDAIQKDYWRRRDTLFLKWFENNMQS